MKLRLWFDDGSLVVAAKTEPLEPIWCRFKFYQAMVFCECPRGLDKSITRFGGE